MSPAWHRRSQTSSLAASARSRTGFEASFTTASSRASSRCGAGGSATGTDSHARSAAVIGVFTVASHALAMPVGDPVGQDLAVLVRTVVPLARADVAAGPVEVDVGDPGGLLPLVAGHAGEVGVGQPGPVVALGVRGVVGQGHDRLGRRPRS